MISTSSDNPIRITVDELFSRYKLDIIWFKNLPTIKFLTGFTGSTANLLITRDGKKVILVDSRYTTQAGQECRVDEVREISKPLEDLCNMVKELACKTLGFEANETTFADYRELGKHLEAQKLVPIDENLAALRLVKNEDDLNKLRAANQIANKAFTEFVAKLHVGWSENEAAWYLEQRFREHGATGLSFDTLVCSGPRSAIVHGKPSDAKFAEGEFIIVDRGIMADHFASDETNTFVLGSASQKQKEIYQVVKDAHDLCIDAIRPGVLCNKLDSIAREYIHEKGYGEYFGHGTGHGVGIEVHEMPHISPRGKGFVEEGMVFSVEPGIYIPDFGGVRIEDVVVVTADGAEILSLADKNKFEIEI